MADEDHFGKEIAENRELERVLSLLKPAAGTIDRDRFLFLAGRASAEADRQRSVLGRWAWPAAALSSSAAAIVLSVLLATRAEPSRLRPDSIAGDSDRASATAASDGAPAAAPQTMVPRPSRLRAPEVAEIGSAAELNYPRLRSLVLAFGVDALPERGSARRPVSDPTTDIEPQTQREMLEQFLKSDRSAHRSSTNGTGVEAG